MKKLLFFCIALFTALQVNATHLLGGEIYYTKTTLSNEYRITLLLYRDVSGVNLGTSQSVKTTVPGYPTINLGLVPANNQTISMSCVFADVEVLEYTGTILILGAVPVTGYTFSWDQCCRPGGITNLATGGNSGFDIRATMYPGSLSSARFSNFPSIAAVAGKKQFFNYSAYDPDVQDSVYITLSNPKQFQSGVVVNVPFDSAYSKDFPFGLTIPTSLDPNTGVLTVDSMNQGKYATAFRIQSYTNGVLTSVVRRDVMFYVDPLGEIPTISLSNISGATVLSSSSNGYIIDMKESDSLSFNLSATTNQITQGTPSSISLLGYGNLLDTNSSTGGTNCTGTSCATYGSASGSLTGSGSIQTTFGFRPDTSFVDPSLNQAIHVLSFNALVLDSCGVVRTNSISVTLKVRKVGPVYGASTLYSCYGVGVYPNLNGDTSNIVWSPTTGVSNPTSGNPLLNPSSTTTYTVTHVPTGETIQLLVNVDSIGPLSFNLINTGTELIVPFGSGNQVQWYYNGALLNSTSDTLPTNVTGSFWAVVKGGLCESFSDTVKVLVSAKFSNSNTQGMPLNTLASSSSFQFTLNQNGNTLENLEIILPDSSSGKTTALVAVELFESGSLLKTIIASQKNSWSWEATGFNTLLNPGILYEIKISTDLPQTVLFQPSSLPFTEENGVIYFASGSYIVDGNQMSGAYHYVNFEFSSAIGIDENTLEFELYPNPANSHVVIELNGNASIELWDIQGKLVLSQQVKNGQEIEVSQLVSGLYIYKITGANGVSTGKLIKN